jgi:hypothetical protein
MRKQQSVSLNLEQRRVERETLTKDQLDRENERRAALGVATLDDAEDIKDVPDAILSEALQITADLSQIEPRYVARARPAS